MKAIEEMKSFLNIDKLEAGVSSELNRLLMEVEHAVATRTFVFSLASFAIGMGIGHFFF